MARYVDAYQGTLEDAFFMIGLILSKSGPIDVTEEDMELYRFSRLRPHVISDDDRSGFRAFLVGEDELSSDGEPNVIR